MSDKTKINPKSNEGLWLRFNTINPMVFYRGEHRIEIQTFSDDDFDSKKEFMGQYFKDIFNISETQLITKNEKTETPDGDFIDEENVYMGFSISLKDANTFWEEVYSYLDDLADSEIPFSDSKQIEIIKNLIKNKYQESENKRICLTVNDFDWSKFIHIKFFSILKQFEKDGFIEKIDITHFFERLPTTIEFRRPKLYEYEHEINRVRKDFFFEVEIILSDKFLEQWEKTKKELVGKRPPLLKMVEELWRDKNMIVNEKAKFENGILYFFGKEINFNNKQNQKDLLTTLFKDSQKNWAYDEVQHDWDETDEDKFFSGDWWKRFYNAGCDINTEVEKKTQISDFIIKNTKEIRINPQYI
jgi:hypothetical protein